MFWLNRNKQKTNRISFYREHIFIFHRNKLKQSEFFCFWFHETNLKQNGNRSFGFGLFRFELIFCCCLFRGHPSRDSALLKSKLLPYAGFTLLILWGCLFKVLRLDALCTTSHSPPLSPSAPREAFREAMADRGHRGRKSDHKDRRALPLLGKLISSQQVSRGWAFRNRLPGSPNPNWNLPGRSSPTPPVSSQEMKDFAQWRVGCHCRKLPVFHRRKTIFTASSYYVGKVLIYKKYNEIPWSMYSNVLWHLYRYKILCSVLLECC